MTNLEIVQATVVTDSDSVYEGLYVDGELIDQDTTIYACDIAAATSGKMIRFAHVVVDMPEGAAEYPQTLAECLLWKQKTGGDL